MINITSYAKPKQNGGSTSTSTIKTIVKKVGGTTTVSTDVNGVNIWGQYHDHKSDVSGDMTGVGNITGTGNLVMNGIDAVKGQITNLTVDETATITNVAATDIHTNTLNTDGNVEVGGNLNVDSTIIAVAGEIDSLQCNDSVTTNTLRATEGTIDTLNSTTATIDTATLKNLITDVLNATNATIDTATIDNLTVTKAAHFFELIIDEIKATKGQLILSPANAKIDYVIQDGTSYYNLYFRANDADGNEIYNMFAKNDLIVCQTFNAAQGTNYNLSNRFYWCKVTNVSTNPVKVSAIGDDNYYHKLYVSMTSANKDANSNATPVAGDEVVVLGNTTDTSRQNAIIIGAYDNAYLDSEIKAPFIVQYSGINEFNLSNHRLNVLSNGLNDFKGNHYDNDGNSISNSISELKQTASSITASVKEYVKGDNVLTGVGNGSGWKLITVDAFDSKEVWTNAEFAEAGFTFTYPYWTWATHQTGTDDDGNPIYENFKVTKVVYSPSFTNVFDTYTISFYVWQKNIQIEILGDSTVINTITTDDVYKDGEMFDDDGNVIEYDGKKLRYSKDLDRYYFTFSKSTASEYSFRFTNTTDTLKDESETTGENRQMQCVMVEQGDTPHRFNFSYATNESKMFITPTSAGFMTTDKDGNVATIGTYTDGVVKLTGDNIKLEGVTTINNNFVVNEDGTINATNGTFNGTVKATNFYHKVAIYGYTNRCWFDNGQYYDSDAGLSDDRIENCGSADIVIMTNESFYTTDSLSTTKRRHLTLPRAKDYVGKVIEVYDAHTEINGTEIFVKSVDDGYMVVGAHNGSTFGAQTQYQSLTGGYGHRWKYVALSTGKTGYETYYWMKLTDSTY